MVTCGTRSVKSGNVITRPAVLILMSVALFLVAYLARVVLEIVIRLTEVGVSTSVKRWITKRRRDDFLPLSLSVLGMTMSVGAVCWGVLAPPGDFLLNILATLAVIGPGLVVTNVLVARIESSRKRQQIEGRTAPLLLLLLSHFNEFIQMGNDFLEMATAVAKKHDAKAIGYTAMPLANNLYDAKIRLKFLHTTAIYIDADPPPGGNRYLPLPGHSLEFPDTHGIRNIVERIDQDVPIPNAVLAAQMLYTFAERVGIDFFDRYNNTSIYQLPGEESIYKHVQPTKVGFTEASAYAYPPYGSDPAEERCVDIIKYAECLMNTLNKAATLVEVVLIEIPDYIPLPQERLQDHFDSSF